MDDQSNALSDQFLSSFIESLPSVTTILVGFFIFHILASRRQRRDEIFKLVEFIRGAIDEAVDDAKCAWTSTGADAVKNGHVFSLRARLMLISLEIEHLCDQNKSFVAVRENFSRFRSSVDEMTVEGESGVRALSVDDQTRDALDRPPQNVYNCARSLQTGLHRIYSNIYGTKT